MIMALTATKGMTGAAEEDMLGRVVAESELEREYDRDIWWWMEHTSELAQLLYQKRSSHKLNRYIEPRPFITQKKITF